MSFTWLRCGARSATYDSSGELFTWEALVWPRWASARSSQVKPNQAEAKANQAEAKAKGTRVSDGVFTACRDPSSRTALTWLASKGCCRVEVVRGCSTPPRGTWCAWCAWCDPSHSVCVGDPLFGCIEEGMCEEVDLRLLDAFAISASAGGVEPMECLPGTL
eukprot:scaffold1435_cov267-Pinguiococcus_pyrenoidosus.AAC.38